MLYRIFGLILAATILFGCGEVEISTPEEVSARFIKLDSNGDPLAVQNVAWDARWFDGGSSYAHWDCVRDTQTGLIWEVKGSPADVAINNANNTYSWFEFYTYPYDGDPSDPEDPIHDPDDQMHNPKYADQDSGAPDKGECFGTLCDTKRYAEKINAENLCDLDGTWGLPTVADLKTLNVCTTDTETCQLNTTAYISLDHFPNTRRGFYWSNEMSIALDKTTDAVDFRTGDTYGALKDSGHYIRLVFTPTPIPTP